MRYILQIFVIFTTINFLYGCQPQNFNVEDENEIIIQHTDSSFVTVAEALQLRDTIVTVKGYIAGCIEGNSISKANFNPPFNKESNLIITDTKEETTPENCLPIQLTANSANRKALNLVSHPENYHKMILLRGKLEKYFSRSGIKKITAYRLLEGDIPNGQERYPDVWVAAEESDSNK